MTSVASVFLRNRQWSISEVLKPCSTKPEDTREEGSEQGSSLLFHLMQGSPAVNGFYSEYPYKVDWKGE